MRDAEAGPRWLHWWAVLTALATLPLLFLGAEVTTKQVGMVDPVWPTAPHHLAVNEWRPYGIGYLIEHGHRLAGYTVGLCAIVLAVGMCLFERRPGLRWLGVAALAAVCVQGLLGGFRVRLNALFGPDLALVHGVFGQMVFALLVVVACCTSSRWAERPEHQAAPEESAPLRRWSLALFGLVVAQLVLGAWLRHKGAPLAQRLHVFGAFAVAAVAVWLLREAKDGRAADRRLAGLAHLVVALIGVQVLLGVEAWIVKFSSSNPSNPGHWLFNRDLVRSIHAVTGSIILATATVLALAAQRRTARTALAEPLPGRHLEGVA